LLVTSMTTWLGRGDTLVAISASGAPLALVVGAGCVVLLYLCVRIPTHA